MTGRIICQTPEYHSDVLYAENRDSITRIFNWAHEQGASIKVQMPERKLVVIPLSTMTANTTTVRVKVQAVLTADDSFEYQNLPDEELNISDILAAREFIVTGR